MYSFIQQWQRVLINQGEEIESGAERTFSIDTFVQVRPIFLSID
jgi:hypothetical protein